MNVATNEAIRKCFTVFIINFQITDIKLTRLLFSGGVIYVLVVCIDF